VRSVTSNDNLAVVKMNIRDHDKARYEARKRFIAEAVRLAEAHHPKAKFKFSIEDSYGNIADALGEDTKACVDTIYQAMARLGIEPKTVAMRGGTDGSCLSARGIPTPNFFTGAHNFHSPCEFLPIPSFELSCRMVLEISRLVSEVE
jgi:tripeptide aminopeptidase